MSNALLHAFTDPTKPESEFVNIVRAKGSTVHDDKGRSYIDGMASLWYCQVGHGRPEIIEAITAQLHQLDAYNIFDPFTNPAAQRVAEMIVERSPFDGGRVFLGCSGSEAVDTVLKLARLLPQSENDPDRQIIVKRTRGYHGTNFGGTSAQGIAPNREGWGDLVPHMSEVEPDDIEAMSVLFEQHGERIAAVITEPVQGAGGVFPPPEGYLEGLRRLCDDHGALLIFDEVITGFGRTGSWFASQTYDVKPDMMSFAKAVTSGYQPLSGVVVSSGVAQRLAARNEMLRTGYTYSGHPTACAAAIANIELIEAEGLIERAVHLGERFDRALAAMVDDGLALSHRGVGALWAIELGRPSTPSRDALLELGFILRPIGTALAVCPPLVLTDDEQDSMLDAVADVLARGL